MNPFEAKFRKFSEKLTTTNAEGNAEHIAAKSGEVFKDKPFTEEYHGVYTVAQVGQSVAQVVTYLTTAALGVFALTHIVPLAWGVYLAVPLGLLFAFGVEKVKRSTLAIASKHLLKYKEFGFVGIVAALVMCVSIAAALYGAKELPGVVYAKPPRVVDDAAAVALTADIERVQKDIDRTAAELKSGKNWIAENKTLPNLQKQRAALVERRDAAAKDAAGRGDSDHAEALADRAEKVEKMQVYAVGAAIVAELIFLLTTGFILYYLFRHYAEQNHDAQTAAQDAPPARTPQVNGAMNGRPVASNLNATGEGAKRYTIPADAPPVANATVNATVTQDHFNKECAQCGTPFYAKVGWQRFCTEPCKLAYHEAKHGTRFDPGRARHKKAST